MTEHESDMWPERRWGLFCPPHKQGVEQARPFKSEKERDAWVAANPSMRKSVGGRHPAVKALRARWRAKALEDLRERKRRGAVGGNT